MAVNAGHATNREQAAGAPATTGTLPSIAFELVKATLHFPNEPRRRAVFDVEISHGLVKEVVLPGPQSKDKPTNLDIVPGVKATLTWGTFEGTHMIEKAEGVKAATLRVQVGDMSFVLVQRVYGSNRWLDVPQSVNDKPNRQFDEHWNHSAQMYRWSRVESADEVTIAHLRNTRKVDPVATVIRPPVK